MNSLDIVQQRLSNQHLAGNPLFGHFLVIDGRMVGTWRRVLRKDTVTITLKHFEPLSEA